MSNGSVTERRLFIGTAASEWCAVWAYTGALIAALLRLIIQVMGWPRSASIRKHCRQDLSPLLFLNRPIRARHPTGFKEGVDHISKHTRDAELSKPFAGSA